MHVYVNVYVNVYVPSGTKTSEQEWNFPGVLLCMRLIGADELDFIFLLFIFFSVQKAKPACEGDAQGNVWKSLSSGHHSPIIIAQCSQ